MLISLALCWLIVGCVKPNPPAANSEPDPDLATPKLAGQDFVVIPAGEFLMGSNDSSADDDEQPVHQVQITKPFFAGQHEVTVGQILTWLNSSGVEVADNWIDFEDSDCPIKKSGSRYVLNTSSKFGKSDRQPMVQISWYGATAYCAWASQHVSGFRIRLPTEAEWEYMCRAGSTTKYPWGDSIDKDDANYGGDVGATTEVGKYPANAFGLSDMIGNVYEWCEDVYDSEFYASSAATQPNPANLDSSSGSSRVVRGGSWFNHYYNDVRSSNRYNHTPALLNLIGFRVVAD